MSRIKSKKLLHAFGISELVKDNHDMSIMRKVFIVCLAIAFMASLKATKAQAVSDISSQIRSYMDAGDWNSARNEIQKLRSVDHSLFQAKGYDYLLARLEDNAGNLPEATKGYQSLLTNNSFLSEYACWHLARIARSTGDLVLEREHLRKLIAVAPNSLMSDAANLRLAESFFESEDYPSAVTSAAQVANSKNLTISRESKVLQARSLVNLHKLAEALGVFNDVLMHMPDASKPDDFALAAVRELDDPKNGNGGPTANLSEADHLLRASVYQFNRDFAGARVHYQAVIDANPQSGAVPNATFMIGRGLYLESKYDDALKAFQRVVSQSAQSQSARDAQLALAATFLRLKRPDDAIAAYKTFITTFPDAPNPERAYLNIIDALHEAGRYSEALNWVQQTRARFPNQTGAALALFAQQRIHLAESAWADVVRDADELTKFADLGGTRIPGGTTEAEVLFLRAFALEQLGRTEEAIKGYLAIQDGRNEYYGARATQRLLSLADSDRTRNLVANSFNSFVASAKVADAQNQFDQSRSAAQNALRLTSDKAQRTVLLDILKRAYESLPNYKLRSFQMVSISAPTSPAGNDHQSLGTQLFDLGLYDEALPELFMARLGAGKPATGPPLSDEQYTLAKYSLRGGLANQAVRFGEQFWKTVPADYVLEVAPRDLVELLYPTPFRDSLLKHTTSRSLDPRFVLSIIRQESRYQVDVKSVSAARGMMQFIPATADEIATQLKLNGFTQDDLYNGDTAILFGAQYLANLFKQFPNQPQAVAGSYNGGADNLARWIARSRSNEADRYVPEIGFSQTKDYVYKVMSNYWNYQRLYDKQLQPITK